MCTFFYRSNTKKNRLNWKNSNIHWKSYTMCVRRLQRFQRIWFNKCEMAILLKIQKSKWVLKKTRILNGFECWTLFFQCYVHCALEMLHLIDGTVGQFHVAGQHTDYMIPHELFQTTIKAFGHCEGLSNWIYLFYNFDGDQFFLRIKMFHFSAFHSLANGMTDNCEAAYTMLKCFRENNNEFWLP